MADRQAMAWAAAGAERGGDVHGGVRAADAAGTGAPAAACAALDGVRCRPLGRAPSEAACGPTSDCSSPHLKHELQASLIRAVYTEVL